MIDETVAFRQAVINVRAEEGPLTREQLIVRHNSEVYDTDELRELYEVELFMAPFVVVKRRADGKRGSMEFQHMPRFYFAFSPE